VHSVYSSAYFRAILLIFSSVKKYSPQVAIESMKIMMQNEVVFALLRLSMRWIMPIQGAFMLELPLIMM
jgi:hypothetical protein